MIITAFLSPDSRRPPNTDEISSAQQKDELGFALLLLGMLTGRLIVGLLRCWSR